MEYGHYGAISPVGDKIWLGYQQLGKGEWHGGVLWMSSTSGEVKSVREILPAFDSRSVNLSLSKTSADGFPIWAADDQTTGVVSLYSLQTGKLKLRPAALGRRNSERSRNIAVSPDGRYTAIIGTDEAKKFAGLILSRNDSGASVACIPMYDTTDFSKYDIVAVQWLSASRFVMKRELPQPLLVVYDWDGAKFTKTVTAKCSAGAEMAVSSDGKRAITGTYENGSLKVVNLETARSTGLNLTQVQYGLRRLRFIDGTYRFSVCYDIRVEDGTYRSVVAIYDAAESKPKLVRTFEQPTSVIQFSMGLVSPDGRWVAMGNEIKPAEGNPRARHRLTLFRVSDGSIARSYDTEFVDAFYSAMEFSPDSSKLVYNTGIGNLTTAGSYVSFSVPTGLAQITFAPSTVVGGTTAIATVTLEAPQKTATDVTLASNTSSAKVPAKIRIPAGQTSATFSVVTKGVDADTTATISATALGETRQGVLTITAR